MSPRGTPRVAVVGGGITGLSGAYHVSQTRPDVELVLLESRNRLGGNIVTLREQGFVIDGGPDSFLITKPEGMRLCSELGLQSELIAPESDAAKVYMVHAGRLERLPAGMVLAVPTRVGPMLRTPILSPAGKLRVLGDLLLRARPAEPARDDDESISAFITRHFGAEAAERIAGPLLGGIYAGNIGELSVTATFPQLVKLERQYGSVIRGFFHMQMAGGNGVTNGSPAARPSLAELTHLASWLRRDEAHRQSPFRSLRSGMSTLIDTLAARLPAGSVRLGAPVRAISREASGRFRIEIESATALEVDAVILAAPAHAAARMLNDAQLGAELAEIRYESTATVFFALSRAAVRHALDGAGFIVPPKKARILAATWVTSKWAARAPEGQVLLRAFVGGSLDPERVKSSSDEDLVALAYAELERLMGPLGQPSWSRVFRYTDSNPQPTLGHCQRLRRIERHLQRMPGLYVAGAAYDGVGIPDCIRQGRAAAEKALRVCSESHK
ncbi:MAG TPA: protoporphyrinogen oxidase [Polyangiaceae bacterium]|nr:protoporphyrinogen oxidase [Polyangiaceae bacterium]